MWTRVIAGLALALALFATAPAESAQAPLNERAAEQVSFDKSGEVKIALNATQRAIIQYQLPAVSGGGGSAPAFNWVALQGNAFPPQGTSAVVGTQSTGTGGATCGTLVAGTFSVIGVQLYNETTDTITPPSGWTLIGTTVTDGNAFYGWYGHIVGGGETCGYTFSWLNNVFNAWVMVNFVNTNGSSPIDVSSVTVALSGGLTTVTCPLTGSISNTSSPDVLGLIMMTQAITSPLPVAPSDMTSRVSVSQGASGSILLVADKALAAPTSTTETITNVVAAKTYPCLLIALHS